MELLYALVSGKPEAHADDSFKRHPMDSVPVADCHGHLVDFLQNGGYLLNGREVHPPSLSIN